MADFYPQEHGGTSPGFTASPSRPIDSGAIKALSIVRRRFILAAQTTSDLLKMSLPSGFRPAYLGLHPSATLGSSTLAVGINGTAGLYRAAATLTAPSLAPVVMGSDARLTADQAIEIAIGAATLPGSGTLDVVFLGTYE